MRKRILIVEDDQELQELYLAMLEHLDCEIVQVYDGGEAYDSLEEAIPDLIILDLLLDEVMGDKFFLKMKEDVRFARIPVVIASVLPQESCQNLLQMDPRSIFLQKPFYKDDLLCIVRKGLNGEEEKAVLALP
jgi:CheY-like chemotaxis protein